MNPTDIPSRPAAPPRLSQRLEVIVVGAGVIGLTIALRLVDEGRRVVLIDPETDWRVDPRSFGASSQAAFAAFLPPAASPSPGSTE